MKAIARSLVGALVAVLLQNGAIAKRAPPAPVTPLIFGGVIYLAPHFVSGEFPNGGILQARDAQTDKLLWQERVYKIDYDPTIEGDTQDIFIAALSIHGAEIFVLTERGLEYAVDIHSHVVRPVTEVLGTYVRSGGLRAGVHFIRLYLGPHGSLTLVWEGDLGGRIIEYGTWEQTRDKVIVHMKPGQQRPPSFLTTLLIGQIDGTRTLLRDEDSRHLLKLSSYFYYQPNVAFIPVSS